MIIESMDKDKMIATKAVPSTRSFLDTKKDEAHDWTTHEEEGQLAIDVAEVGNDIVVTTTVAGADTKRIEVFVHNDVLTIRGVRHSPLEQKAQVSYFHKECFWGAFSRTVVLPIDVKGDLARAEYTSGVLSVWIPKQQQGAKIPVTIIDE